MFPYTIFKTIKCRVPDITRENIKEALHYMQKPLIYLINLIFTTGEFPKHGKIAKIKPLHKSKTKKDVCNYRPISILNTLSKIVESLLKNRLISYFESHHLFNNSQHGYRAGKSTNTALQSMLKFVYNSHNKGKIVASINCDLSKAFDLVDRKLLLSKLRAYGIRGVPLNLLKSFVSDRYQYVVIDKVYSSGQIVEVKSQVRPVNYGVPQGSILGPILFIIYMNDLPNNLIDTCHICTYADDTSVTIACSQNDLKFTLNKSLAQLINWFNANF
uniref:Reverse transcriptase domain-containing protein n=1 Tax=Photinus pyralis TaxID=7054 RepID=A0A1Y1KC61_PHOPY